MIIDDARKLLIAIYDNYIFYNALLTPVHIRYLTDLNNIKLKQALMYLKGRDILNFVWLLQDYHGLQSFTNLKLTPLAINIIEDRLTFKKYFRTTKGWIKR